MRVNGPATGAARDVLTDMSPVQADRLQFESFVNAMRSGRFEPFPCGYAAAGPPDQVGSVARLSGVEGVQLANGPISGFDGRLPDYMAEALYGGFNAEDFSYRDFLAIFDKRLTALKLAAERAGILVSTLDAKGSRAATVLSRATRSMGRRDGDVRYAELLNPLLNKARPLETLRRMLVWWCGRPVTVTAHFDIRSPVDAEHQSALSARPTATNALGRGALLGRFGLTNAGRLSVDMDCDTRADLDRLSGDADLLSELRSLISSYLRERTPVTVFARLVRAELDPPKLSAHKARASKLGVYGVLTPSRHPDRSARIKLTEISQRG